MVIGKIIKSHATDKNSEPGYLKEVNEKPMPIEVEYIPNAVAQVEDKIAYIEELVSPKQLAPADFRDMKSKYTEQLDRLNDRLAVREQDQDVPGLLDAGIDNLLKLDYIYQDGEIEKKREVIGSMYPEKLTFDGERLRTTRINEAARIIYTPDKAFSENEKGQNGNIPALSS